MPTPRVVLRSLLPALALTAAAWACRPARAPEAAAPAADSLVVERTPCFGTCPAYRVRLTAGGEVRYEPRPPGRGPAPDTTPVVARVDPGTLAALLADAERGGVFAMPERIAAEPSLCAALASDLPTVTTWRYAGGTVRRVEDDHGCRAAHDTTAAARRLAALRAWEARVDSAIGAPRWPRRGGAR